MNTIKITTEYNPIPTKDLEKSIAEDKKQKDKPIEDIFNHEIRSGNSEYNHGNS